MKRASLVLLGAVMGWMSAQATTPQLRGFQTFRQSDGTTVTVRSYSAARYGYYVTRDGLAVLRGDDGDFHYTTLSTDGLALLPAVAHEAETRTAADRALVAEQAATADAATAHLAALFPTTYQRATRSAASTSDGLGAYMTPSVGTVSSIGDITIPVIMVSFSDKDFLPTTTMETLSQRLNESGYHDDYGSVGSVSDYFVAQSGGLFTPHFDIVAKVTASKGYAYYGKDKSGSYDANMYELIQEVLDDACEQGVDFSKYATNGSISNVCIFYAGPGQHSSYEEGWEDYLWAKFDTHNFTTTTGIKIRSYFIGNETLQNYYKEDGTVEYSDADKNYPITQSEKIDGIGVFCHEFSHALGLPDFYYTGSNSTISDTLQTMNYWSVMDYGQYVQDGYAPIGYNAYERSFMGWLDVQELTEAQAVTLPSFEAQSDLPKAYCIRNTSNTNEYYLLENRQPSTWYPSRMGSGLLITHVDYLASAWNNNVVNNVPAHQRFSYVPADGVKSLRTFHDLFPGTNGATEFSDTSFPASTVFMGSGLGKPVYDIAESNGVVTFSYLSRGLTGVDHVAAAAADDSARRIYTLDGRYVKTVSATSLDGLLPAGLYLVEQEGRTQKVVVK